MSARVARPRPDRRARLRTRRRQLLLWSAPFVLIAALLAAKLIAQHTIAQIAISQYHDGDFEASLNTGSLNEQLNIIERWKAPYLVGTDYLRMDALDEAKQSLTRALELAEGQDQCPIRENLAIAHERAGDLALAAEDAATAVTEYEQALKYLNERDASCDQSSSARAIADSIPRITEKLENLQTPPQPEEDDEEQDDSNESPSPTSPVETPPPDETPSPDQTPSPDETPSPEETPSPSPSDPVDDPLDNLEQDMNDNQRDREEGGSGFGGGGRDYVDKPW